MKKMSVLFIFVDGIGFGEGSNNNPFFQANLPTIKKLFGFIPSLHRKEYVSDTT